MGEGQTGGGEIKSQGGGGWDGQAHAGAGSVVQHNSRLSRLSRLIRRSQRRRRRRRTCVQCCVECDQEWVVQGLQDRQLGAHTPRLQQGSRAAGQQGSRAASSGTGRHVTAAQPLPLACTARLWHCAANPDSSPAHVSGSAHNPHARQPPAPAGAGTSRRPPCCAPACRACPGTSWQRGARCPPAQPSPPCRHPLPPAP